MTLHYSGNDMTREAYFTLSDNPESEKLETVWFWDEIAGSEILASDIRAFLDFRMQIEMMDGGDNECAFSGLSRQAKELESTFKACLKIMKKKK